MAGTDELKGAFEVIAKLYDSYLDKGSCQLKKEELKAAVLDTLDPDTKAQFEDKCQAKMRRFQQRQCGHPRGGRGPPPEGGRPEGRGDGLPGRKGEFRCFMGLVAMRVAHELKCNDDESGEE